MNSQQSKRKTPIKSSYQYIIRAKLYGVITLNSLEGMMSELDELIPVDMERDNIDTFSEELRRFQNGSLMPTSHGDYLDRAMKSLAKEINLQVPIDLGNSTMVKTLVMNIILCSQGEERRQFLEWLEQPNELITKSVRFEQLVNHACLCFYKKPLNAVSEDTISFVRRSIHDMLRSKVTKDQLHSQLLANSEIIQHSVETIIPSYEYVDSGMYVQNQINDSDRMLHGVDIMQAMRQPTDKELELMSQGVVSKNDNISL